MSEHIDHHCGIAALVDLENKQDVVHMALPVIWQLRNRGQLGAGLSWVKEASDDGRQIGTIKGAGKVKDVLSMKNIQSAQAVSSLVIAHTRYATNLLRNQDSFHPNDFYDEAATYFDSDQVIELALAFNGNVLMLRKLIKHLDELGIVPRMEGDTEILVQLLVHTLRTQSREDIADVCKNAFKTLEGSFNPVILMPDKVLALRSDWRHPLCYAVRNKLIAVASEDIAIRQLWRDADCIDIPAGTMIEMNVQQQRYQLHELWKPKGGLCFIEPSYFADHRTKMDGVSVSNSRFEAGKILAERDAPWIEKIKMTKKKKQWPIVVSVPDSAFPAGRGLAFEAKLPCVDAIRKRDGHGRTFIEATQHEREDAAKRKYEYDKALIKKRRIILVDDSMVRGTTMRIIVKQLRKKGAKEVHVRLATPPIMGPCFYGIDFPTVQELIARKYSDGVQPFSPDGRLHQDILDAIAGEIGADSVEFLPVTELPRALGREDNANICMSCVTCNHPTKGGEELYHLASTETSASH